MIGIRYEIYESTDRGLRFVRSSETLDGLKRRNFVKVITTLPNFGFYENLVIDGTRIDQESAPLNSLWYDGYGFIREAPYPMDSRISKEFNIGDQITFRLDYKKTSGYDPDLVYYNPNKDIRCYYNNPSGDGCTFKSGKNFSELNMTVRTVNDGTMILLNLFKGSSYQDGDPVLKMNDIELDKLPDSTKTVLVGYFKNTGNGKLTFFNCNESRTRQLSFKDTVSDFKEIINR